MNNCVFSISQPLWTLSGYFLFRKFPQTVSLFLRCFAGNRSALFCGDQLQTTESLLRALWEDKERSAGNGEINSLLHLLTSSSQSLDIIQPKGRKAKKNQKGKKQWRNAEKEKLSWNVTIFPTNSFDIIRNNLEWNKKKARVGLQLNLFLDWVFCSKQKRTHAAAGVFAFS